MAGPRFRAALLLVLAALTQAAHARAPKAKAPAGKLSCAVYSLASAGDAAYGKWVADTIPQVIDPESWSGAAKGGKPVLTYNASRRVLVVLHTPAVQAKVAAFIKQLEKAGASGGEEASEARQNGATQALEAAPARPDAPASAYLVPAPEKRPKHLLHFIIRYEGAGLIDSSVVKFAKAMGGQKGKPQSSWCEPLPPTPPCRGSGKPEKFVCPPTELTPSPTQYPAIPAPPAPRG